MFCAEKHLLDVNEFDASWLKTPGTGCVKMAMVHQVQTW
jgi:hypothetical protein